MSLKTKSLLFILYLIIGAVLIIFVLIIELLQLFNSENAICRYNNQVMQNLLQQIDSEH